MGYISQVAFAARGPKENIVAALTTWRLNPCHPKHLDEVIDGLCVDTTDDCWTLSFLQSCKWYESYTDVRMFTQLFDLLSDDPALDTAFIRVGEDDTDIETKYSGDDPYELLSLQRYVSLEISTDKPLREALSVESP